MVRYLVYRFFSWLGGEVLFRVNSIAEVRTESVITSHNDREVPLPKRFTTKIGKGDQ